MLKNRIIACLDINEGRTVKGVNFESIIDAGDPIALAQEYANQGIDELVFLDITATAQKRKTLSKLVSQIANHINIPFTVGGGVQTLEDADLLLSSGADKISINSAAFKNPKLIEDIAYKFGTQCVVVAVDTKYNQQLDQWQVFLQGGKMPTEVDVLTWTKMAAESGAGEILLTSMNNDGVQSGFALAITDQVYNQLNIPVIASGGAGNAQHFADLFTQTNVKAGLAASIFHFGKVKIPYLKQFLKNQNLPIR